MSCDVDHTSLLWPFFICQCDQCLGLGQTFGQQAVRDVISVVVAQVTLLAQCVQSPDGAWVNVQCVRQTLKRRLVVAWFAGRGSVAVAQKRSVCCGPDGCVCAIESGFGAVVCALCILNAVLCH